MTRSLLAALMVSLWGCGDDDDSSGTGQTCEVAEDCYRSVAGDVPGDPNCFTNVEGGYCSHTCTSDEECCSLEGECDFGGRGSLEEVCAPFEAFAGTYCFLSCEDDVLQLLPEDQRDTYCEDISSDLHCRATGGGDPRRVCLPEG
ncbi:MAG: hypothetical protein HYY06_08505 [Deltaproteobacteria bacterium]|nr:hypothetical protein [Deltaproteobacteria bacterium]